MKLYLKLLLALLFSAIATGSFAAVVEPDELIKQTSEKVLSALEQNKEKYDSQPEEIFKLVNDIILPHLDFRAMSKLALGKTGVRRMMINRVGLQTHLKQC